MPVGATIGAAVIGAGAGIYSSSQASKAQTKAANTAADTSLELADKNNAFATEMYGKNEGHLTPFIDFGTAAGGNLMGLLLGKAPAASTPAATTGSTRTGTGTASATGYKGPSFDRIVAMKGDGIKGDMTSAITGWIDYYKAHPDEDPGVTSAQVARLKGDGITGDQSAVNSILSAYAARPPAASTPTAAPNNAAVRPLRSDYRGDAQGFNAAMAAYRTGATPAAGSSAPNAAQSAWDTFKNSTQYQERLNTGLNATASKYAAAGAFESGAERKAINDYAQMFASNEIANYMDQLYRQEALGAQAASSLAGVGTNLVNQVSANNNNAGNAAANAALVAGQGSANNWNAIGAGVGQVAGAIGGAFGSSYGNSGYDNQALEDSGIYAGAWDF